jgi:hypothetical protein
MTRFLIEKIQELCTIGVLKKAFKTVALTRTVREIRHNIIVVFRTNQSLYNKTMAVVKCSCCSIALVSSYASENVSNPRLATAFRICFYMANFTYSVAGGDVKLILGLSSLVTPKHLIANPFPEPTGIVEYRGSDEYNFLADRVAEPKFDS